MAELKKPKNKHNHKLTDYLKIFIFAMVMIAPFIAIITQCMFATFNEGSTNAYTGVIQDVFYESVDNMVSQPLFAWTQSTGMYNVINGMTIDLEFGTSGNILATLLTYWSLNTAIYIIFDIILWAFTKITHFLNE